MPKTSSLSTATLPRFISRLSRAEALSCVATLRAFAQAVFDSEHTDKLFDLSAEDETEGFSVADLSKLILGSRTTLFDDLKKYTRDIEHISLGYKGKMCRTWLRSHGIEDVQTGTGWSTKGLWLAGKEPHWNLETELLSVQAATWARQWVAEREKEKATREEQIMDDIDNMVDEATGR